jgi:DNA-binding XRE family transcriptional regulator
MSDHRSASRLPVAPVSDGRATTQRQNSSSSGFHQRAKFVVDHGHIVQNPDSQTRKHTSGSEEFSARERDSANWRAADEFRSLRLAAGLTQEAAAEELGTTDRTIRNRENPDIDQGPLAQRYRLAKLARERYLAEEAASKKDTK